jgi:hypothetical protein
MYDIDVFELIVNIIGTIIVWVVDKKPTKFFKFFFDQCDQMT